MEWSRQKRKVAVTQSADPRCVENKETSISINQVSISISASININLVMDQ